MTNTERIEAFFDDQLSATEKEGLLRDIESDQSLKTEFEFQKEVIEGIKVYRKQELIAKLNAVEVASVGTSTLTKILGSLGIAAIVSGGLFWYYSTDQVATTTEENIETIEAPRIEANNNDPVAIIEETATADELVVKEETAEETVRLDPEITTKSVETTPDVQVPEMTEPATEGISAVEDNREVPESINTESRSITSRADVEIKLDKRYDFHYQVINGDLSLYGDFKDSKFEIIELKTNVGIKLYLYYNERYFELKDDSQEIRSLEPVENKKIIEELDKRRL